MKAIDDVPGTISRAECVMTLLMDGARRDLEMCRSINESLSFDTDTVSALFDQIDDIAGAVASLRLDMESHVKATGREWLAEGPCR